MLCKFAKGANFSGWDKPAFIVAVSISEAPDGAEDIKVEGHGPGISRSDKKNLEEESLKTMSDSMTLTTSRASCDAKIV